MNLLDKTYVLALVILMLWMSNVTDIKAQKKMKNVLSEKQQYLVTLAAMEAKGNLGGLEHVLDNALDHALTLNEAKEVFSYLYAYTGFPRSLNALGVLERVVQQRHDSDKPIVEGRDASPLSADYDALSQGTAVQTALRGGKPFCYSFAPAIDYYLKAHLFGDIFARDILTHAERELATVSALAAIEGAEPQLRAHVSGARNMGVTDNELHAIGDVLAQTVGDMEAYRVRKAVSTCFQESFTDVRPIENMIFPKGEPNTAYAKYFIGNSYLAPLLTEDLPLSNVTFEPGCRNNWHIHHKCVQILICVGGEGWYQEWGKPAQKLHSGDMIRIPAEVKHWHGATVHSWFQHIATSVQKGEDASNEWLEPVTDEEYAHLESDVK